MIVELIKTTMFMNGLLLKYDFPHDTYSHTEQEGMTDWPQEHVMYDGKRYQVPVHNMHFEGQTSHYYRVWVLNEHWQLFAATQMYGSNGLKYTGEQFESFCTSLVQAMEELRHA